MLNVAHHLAMRTKLPEVAFYYPGPVWYNSDAMKNMLLFFDGIGLLVPQYLRDKPGRIAPELALPLQELGLLHLLEPETFIDREAAELLAVQMADIIHSGLLDDLESGPYHELSMSRLGYEADAELAQMLFEELKARGLAKESADGLSIPLHHQVRYLILVLLAQILQSRGPRVGLNLVPATDRPRLVTALTDLLAHPQAPSAAHVVATDTNVIGVDLSMVPLDEVLSFRSAHLNEHRAYAVAVREFVSHLSQLSVQERDEAMLQRQTQLRDQASDLRRLHRQAWKKPLSASLGAAGAIWRLSKGDPFGALLASTALLAGYEHKPARVGGAFSFIFAASEPFAF